jgi:hypothetical protein
MRRGSRLTAALVGAGAAWVVVAVFAVSPAASLGPSFRSGDCKPAKSTTLAASRKVRLYSVAHPVPSGDGTSIPVPIYGCLVATGRSRLLNAPARLHPQSPGLQPVSIDTKIIALHAPWAAYPEQFITADTFTLVVAATNLQSGKTAYCEVPGTRAPRRGPSVSAIVLKGDGSVAWIGEANSSGLDEGTLVRTVVACDSTGSRVLDSGEGIDLHSLTLRGSRLNWSDSGITRSASLR